MAEQPKTTIETIASEKLFSEAVQNHITDTLGVNSSQGKEILTKLLDARTIARMRELEAKVALSTDKNIQTKYEGIKAAFKAKIEGIDVKSLFVEMEKSVHDALGELAKTMDAKESGSGVYVSTAEDKIEENGNLSKEFITRLLNHKELATVKTALENTHKATPASEKEDYEAISQYLLEYAKESNLLFKERGAGSFMGTAFDLGLVKEHLETLITKRESLKTLQKMLKMDPKTENSGTIKDYTQKEYASLERPTTSVPTVTLNDPTLRKQMEEERNKFPNEIATRLEQMGKSFEDYEAFKREALLPVLKQLNEVKAELQSLKPEQLTAVKIDRIVRGKFGNKVAEQGKTKIAQELARKNEVGTTMTQINVISVVISATVTLGSLAQYLSGNSNGLHVLTPLIYVPEEKSFLKNPLTLNEKDVAPLYALYKGQKEVYSAVKTANEEREAANTDPRINDYLVLRKLFSDYSVYEKKDGKGTVEAKFQEVHGKAKALYNKALGEFQSKYSTDEAFKTLTGDKKKDQASIDGVPTLKTYLEKDARASTLSYTLQNAELFSSTEHRFNHPLRAMMTGEGLYNDLRGEKDFRDNLKLYISAKDYLTSTNGSTKDIGTVTTTTIEQAQKDYLEALANGDKKTPVIPNQAIFLSLLPEYSYRKGEESSNSSISTIKSGNDVVKPLTEEEEAALKKQTEANKERAQKAFDARIQDLATLLEMPATTPPATYEKVLETAKAQVQGEKEKMLSTKKKPESFDTFMKNEKITATGAKTYLEGLDYKALGDLQGAELLSFLKKISALAKNDTNPRDLLVLAMQKTWLREKVVLMKQLVGERTQKDVGEILWEALTKEKNSYKGVELQKENIDAYIKNRDPQFFKDKDFGTIWQKGDAAIGSWHGIFMGDLKPEEFNTMINDYEAFQTILENDVKSAEAVVKEVEEAKQVYDDFVKKSGTLAEGVTSLNVSIEEKNRMLQDPLYQTISNIPTQKESYTELRNDLQAEMKKRVHSIDSKRYLNEKVEDDYSALIQKIETYLQNLTLLETTFVQYYKEKPQGKTFDEYCQEQLNKTSKDLLSSLYAEKKGITTGEKVLRTKIATFDTEGNRTKEDLQERRKVLTEEPKNISTRITQLESSKDRTIGLELQAMNQEQNACNAFIANMHLVVESIDKETKGNFPMEKLEKIGLFYGIAQEYQEAIREKRTFLLGKTKLEAADQTILEDINKRITEWKGYLESTGLSGKEKLTQIDSKQIDTLFKGLTALEGKNLAVKSVEAFKQRLAQAQNEKTGGLSFYAKVLDREARAMVTSEDLERNVAYLKARKEMGETIVKLNTLLGENSPIVFTPEMFGFNSQSPYDTLTNFDKKDKSPKALENAKSAVDIILRFKGDIFGNFDNWGSAKAYADDRGIKVQDTAGMFSPIEAVDADTPYINTLKIKGKENITPTLEERKLRAHLFNTLLLAMPKRTDNYGKVKEKPPVSEALSQHIENIIGLGDFSPTEIAEAMMRAEHVKGSDKIADIFEKHIGKEKIKDYVSRNDGFRIKGKYQKLTDAVILTMPDRFYYVGEKLYRAKIKIALKDGCMNANPGVGMVRMEEIANPMLPGYKEAAQDMPKPEEIKQFDLKNVTLVERKDIITASIIPPIYLFVPLGNRPSVTEQKSGHVNVQQGQNKGTKPFLDQAPVPPTTTTIASTNAQVNTTQTNINSVPVGGKPAPELVPTKGIDINKPVVIDGPIELNGVVNKKEHRT